MNKVADPPPGARPASGAARRQEIRMPVQLLATLTPADGIPASVQLVDLSRGGACCRVARAFPKGSEVELRLDGLSARATICWASGALVGLRFAEPLRASDILIQSSRSRGSAAPDRPVRVEASGRSGGPAG